MMRILFTTSEKRLAKLIRWATGEDCSHCALEWDGVIVHSNWKGVNVQHKTEFLKENRIVHEVEIKEDLDKFTNAIVNNDGSLYDVGALLFLGIVLLSRKVINSSWPKMNLWQSTGMYLCTELVSQYLYGEADSMITPYKLYLKVKGE